MAMTRLPIDFSPVPDPDDFNKASAVMNAVNDAIVSLPNAVSLSLPRKLFTAGRPRSFRQTTKAVDHSVKITLGKLPKLLLSRTLDDETIGVRHA